MGGKRKRRKETGKKRGGGRKRGVKEEEEADVEGSSSSDLEFHRGTRVEPKLIVHGPETFLIPQGQLVWLRFPHCDS